MRRIGQLIGFDPARLAEYRAHHANLWPEIAAAIHDAGIRNYSIFHRDAQLFAYFEYHGPDDEFEARMAALARAPRMREWWDIMEPMQRPLDDRPAGSWWAPMDEVFHLRPVE